MPMTRTMSAGAASRSGGLREARERYIKELERTHADRSVIESAQEIKEEKEREGDED